MRVFISSTCYDLIDVRAEVAALLTEMGIDPVLSDDKLSDFEIRHDFNSIETCLVNVDSCDEVIVILNQRYGPTLEQFGYGPYSATHLEYNRAREKGKPIHFFVRDRTEGEYIVWKKQRENLESLNLTWLGNGKQNLGVFNLLANHAKLTSESSSSNWYSTFTSSVDLKMAIEKRLRRRIRREALMKAISVNQFPLLAIEAKRKDTPTTKIPNAHIFSWNFRNVSLVAAFSVRIEFLTHKPGSYCQEILVPNESITILRGYEDDGPESDLEDNIRLTFKSALGVEVAETHRFSVFVEQETQIMLTGMNLLSRDFRPCDPIAIELDNG